MPDSANKTWEMPPNSTDLRIIESMYSEFCQGVAEKFEAFAAGKYDTLEKDVADTQIIKTKKVQANYSKIKEIYPFLRTIKEIFSLPFARTIRETAEKYGFIKERSQVSKSADLTLLALDLASKFRTVGKRFYTTQDFGTLIFEKQQPVLDNDHELGQIQIVPFLRFHLNKENRLANISPQPMGIISDYLSLVFRGI